VNRETLLLHGGREPGAAGDPVVPPLVQSVNYVMGSDGEGALRYSRYGNTPSAEALHRRLALLEGADAALVLSSGMAATACTMLALLRAGDHLVASTWLYGGTRTFLEQELPAMGIEVTFIDPTETRGWRRAMRRNTRVLFLESPVNPPRA
jgi:cystathionine beta-lyase/cystathionine gamma-synthase